METAVVEEVKASPVPASQGTVFAILYAISFSHLLNDTIQALIPSIYPLLKSAHGFTFTQLGLITLAFQCTASLLQPLVGYLTDKRPMPYSLAGGMALTLVGLVALSVSHTFPAVVISSALVGMGSAVFHPEASRVAHMAAGNSRGLAQSLFQVGGNAGSSLGPLLAALIIVPRGQGHVAWFSLAAGVGIFVLWKVGSWQSQKLRETLRVSFAKADQLVSPVPKVTVLFSLAILVALIFSKYVYLVSLTNYYTFYLMEKFHVSVTASQVYLFIFLFAVAAGTIIGGPIGDRIGRKRVIWTSILGVAPFSLWLPHASLPVTAILSVFIGLILASAFSAILVYAQELLPGKVGLIAGLFFGLAFGIAGIGAAVLGKAADHAGIISVFEFCAYLPLIGMLTIFLPDVERRHVRTSNA
ncbi:MAG TPA: MFS transporter [Chthoniobacteraceae bacterium]|nr:MFS transporter [Chthoniobacteraceae bacterium]